MHRLKELQAAHFLGIILIIMGLVNPQFILIRPNRIEVGSDVSFYAAISDTYLLIVSSIAFVVLLSVYLYLSMIRNRQTMVQLAILIVIFTLFLFVTGGAAAQGVTSLGTAARASLGSGFWLMLFGIILLLWQASEQRGPMSVWMIVLCFFSVLLLFFRGLLKDISLVREFTDKSERILGELLMHIQLSLMSCVVGFVIGVCLSYIAYRKRYFEGFVSSLANFAQVIPTLSLLGLLMIPLTALALRFPALKALGISGIGFFPAFIVLTLYTLLPITANALAGFRSIPISVIEAAQAMGMKRHQLLFQVELPMALPSLFTGFRIALVQTIGNAILAGLVGGGGLGTVLFLGLAQSAPDLVLVASLMVVSIAVLCEVVLSSIETGLRHKLRGELLHD